LFAFYKSIATGKITRHEWADPDALKLQLFFFNSKIHASNRTDIAQPVRQVVQFRSTNTRLNVVV